MFSQFSRLKLRHKFTLAMLGLVVAIIGVVLNLLYSRQKQLILSEVEARAIDLSTVLAFAGVRACLENDYLELQELVDSISNRESVQQVMVLSPEGKVLAHNYTAERGKTHPGQPRRNPDGSNEPVVVTRQDGQENFLDVTMSVIVAGEQKAFVRIILSLKKAERAIQEILGEIILLGFLSVVVALILAAFLSGLVIKPLQRLYREAQKISQGAREVKIEVTARDEIGTLQQALKTMIEEVRLRSRLAALGVTMANLSHEIKTPLLVITKYLSDFSPQNGETESRGARHAKVLDEVNRLNDLVKQLLGFSQNRKLMLSRTNINDLIEQALFILEAPIKERRLAVTLNADKIPAITADKSLLQSVFMNLITNAIEAMENDGTLLIQTRFVARQEPVLPAGEGLPLKPMPLAGARKTRLHRLFEFLRGPGRHLFIKPAAMAETAPAAPTLMPANGSADDWLQKMPLPPFPPEKDAIEITIADNGQGIPEDLLDKLFLPFVSMKKTGIGLGLALSYKVIEEHAGAIRVQSKVGKGTRFIVTLPV
jgi:signal transduction histidine kinase